MPILKGRTVGGARPSEVFFIFLLQKITYMVIGYEDMEKELEIGEKEEEDFE